MKSQKSTKRRSSDPETSEELAVVRRYFNQIPPPLPYLPNDYQPSVESHFVSFDQPYSHHTRNKRRRSQPTQLAIEGSSSEASEVNDHIITIHNEIVPYRDWNVIARNNQKNQVVLYNRNNQAITVQNYMPHFSTHESSPTVEVESNDDGFCPYCLRPMINTPDSDQPDYMDRNYFRLLASSQASTESNSPIHSGSNTFSHGYPDISNNQNLNENAFNQGYYAKFFVELKKLGKGFRGSVFLCEHMLDGVKLGKYAVKKVAIGDNHPWLVRMLREVHLLERLRHPNSVSYKHAWLEYSRLTPFGPKVPCLFILMECANGGNLEEYFEWHTDKTEAKKRKDLKRERIKKQYQAQESFEEDQGVPKRRLLKMSEIWSLFFDIVQGLAHLHQQNIVHRDLKPPNLLLQYDARHRRQEVPRVLISDFGECEDLDETTSNDNRTGATGTLEFMAPEHVRINPKGRNMVDYSPKADMWSLGMVLYFLCYSRLPYKNIDDVDILRSEILSFKEIEFPKSRLDIYKEDPALYQKALEDPDLTPDIPNELKLLIRVLLSLDPLKRPSCIEILAKIRNRRRNESDFLFQNIPTDWHQFPTSSSLRKRKSIGKGGFSKEEGSKSPEDQSALIKKLPDPRSSYDNSESSHSAMEEEVSVKRQRLIETVQIDKIEPEVEKVENESQNQSQNQSRLDFLNLSRAIQTNAWLTKEQSAKVFKIIIAVLKITTCNYSCSPYSAKPTTLYPIIFLALLDFWHPSNSPSFLLLMLHIVWIILTTLLGTGLCQL